MNGIRNVKALKEQRDNIKELLRLCKENPDLPILPQVGTEIVADDSHSWWLGAFGKPHIEEILTKLDGSVICKSDDSYDGHYETFFGNDDDFNENATDEEAKEKVDGLPWLRCIMVDIGTPEYDIPEGRDGNVETKRTYQRI